MNKILEDLQARAAEAKKRLDDANAGLAVAQQAQQQAQQSFNVWNLAAQIEIRDEQQRQTIASEKQLALPTAAKSETPPSVPPPADQVEHVIDNSEVLNKTNVVRELLRQHPAGMSAVDIWKEVGQQFKHRPYLYSVLKRLRDRQEIIKRRNNRYCLTVIPKAEEVKEQPVVH